MATLQITLDDETFGMLVALAERKGQSAEIVAAKLLKVLMERAEHRAAIDQIADEILERYADVFHRLANS